MAIIRLETGPAAEIRAEPVLGFLRLYGLKGTGLPQPIPINSKARVPKTSKCEIGLSVSLPSDLAVLSPSLVATNA